VQGLLLAIEQSGFTRLLQTVPGLYPAISALHLLGISLLIGPILIVDWALLRNRIGPWALLQRVAAGGFVLAAITGIALFTVQATKYAYNPAMLGKLGLIGLAGANLLAFRWIGMDRPRGFALCSLVIWLGVLLSGRFIAFL
jgi:hypothetical protein